MQQLVLPFTGSRGDRENSGNHLTFSSDNTTLLQYSDRDNQIPFMGCDNWHTPPTRFITAVCTAVSTVLRIVLITLRSRPAFSNRDIVRVWNAVTGTLVHTLEHSDFAYDVVYSANSRTLH